MSLPNSNYVPLPPEDAQGLFSAPAAPELAADVVRALDAHFAAPSQAEHEEQRDRTLLHPLHPELDQAIDSEDVARVLDELAMARRRFHPDATFNTAINRAVKSGHLHILRLLMSEGVPATYKDLETAARSGYIPVLAHLMEHLSWPVDKVSDYGLTLLTLAVEHQDMVSWLLAHGADVNQEDDFAETPLSRAVERGTKGAIQVLLEAGADVSRGAPLQASLIREKEGNENLEITKDLLRRGAPVNRFAGENSPIWDKAGFEQPTALHVACKGCHRNLPAVRLLLAYGANPRLNRRIRGVERPYTSAFESAESRGYTDIVAVIQAHEKTKSDDYNKSNL